MSEHKSRRDFLKIFGLGAAAVPMGLGSLGTALASGGGGRKNVILILTDQQRDVMWFPPGWEQRNLPAMTFLKQHGMTFTQAVNNTCACTPSRTTIFTGKQMPTHGSNATLTEFFQPTNATATAFNNPEKDNTNTPTAGPYPTALSYNEHQLDQTMTNLATVLADAGYDVFYKGKFHLSKGILGYDNYFYAPDITRYGFQEWEPPDAGQDAQIENYGGGDANHDARYTREAVSFLRDRVKHPGKYKRPFCLVFSLINPHDVLGYPNNWVSPTNNGGYGPKDLRGPIGLPPTLYENLTKNFKPNAQASWLRVMGKLRGPQRKNYINFYGNLMRHVDHEIQLVLDVITSSKDFWKDTLIVRSSDHGEMGLTHSGMRQKWFNVYEESLRVPLVFSNPEMFPKPMTSDALVSLVDLLPTIASFCGLKNLDRYNLQGHDFTSLFTNPTGKVQDYTYFINTDLKAGQNVAQAAATPNNVAMIRDAKFKFARYYGGQTPNGTTSKRIQQEFYNLVTDVDPETGEPVELQNKSRWAIAKGAPWKVAPYEARKRTEMEALLAAEMKDGVLADQSKKNIPPVPMKPRARIVNNAWGSAVAATPEVYQVVFYSQYTYQYMLQIYSGGVWSDVPSTTDLISTTLVGNNGPVLFQAQPTLAQQPVYRVARTSSKGVVTYEDVVWVDYAEV